MKLFPTVISLAVFSCLVCNVQQSYAKKEPGQKKGKVTSRVIALEEALGAITNATSRLSDQMASLAATVKAFGERVKKTDAEGHNLMTKTTAMAGKIGLLETRLNNKRCVSGRVDFTDLHSQRTIDNVRTAIKRVVFRTPFATVPVMTAAFVYMDVYNTANLRARAFIEQVTTSSFYVKVQEWNISNNYKLVVAWMACSN